MGFNVTFYTLSKRDNSTKRPSGNGTTYECVLKHSSGILSPSISLNLGLTNNPSRFNYVYIETFGRYYFIKEWLFEDRLWTANLEVDVLATYKEEIGNTNLYVLRAYAENDGRVVDTIYPTLAGCSFNRSTKGNPWQTSSFVVGVITKEASFGSLSYYLMNAQQLTSMCTALTDYSTLITEANGFQESDGSQALQMSLVDPIQYIKTCMMLPVSQGDISPLGGGSTITVYNWPVGTGMKIYPSSEIHKSYTFPIPKHPDTNSRGMYVNSAPFTSLTLTIPPWGCIEIDTTVTCNADELDVEVEVDPISGKGILVVKCNNIILNRVESQIGVPISLSSVTRNYTSPTSMIKSAVGQGLSALSGMLTDGGWNTGSFKGVGDALSASVARAQTVGSTGSFVANKGEFRLDAQFFRPVADDVVHNGRPLCKVRKPANLGGYMLIQDGDVTINGTNTEDGKIRNYLESGFYYE